MLAAVRPFASPGHARITLPGPEGGYGRAVDGLEGFARTFLLAGFRIAGERGAGPRRARSTGTPGASRPAPTRPRPSAGCACDEHPQAKVEAASIALILDLTRPWIWDRLTPAVQERVVDYLAPAVGDDTYPRINWVWFRLVVQTFLRSVGGPHSLDEMAEDLATHDTLRPRRRLAVRRRRPAPTTTTSAGRCTSTRRCGRGWPARPTSPPPRRERDVATLDRFLTDAVALVGADGSPLIQGRSLIYRFAAAAPFWVGAARRRAVAVAGPAAPGRERASSAHFVEHTVPDERGLLTIGWHGAVAAAGPVLLRPRLALLGGQGHARHRAAGRPSGVDGRRRAAARARLATRCAPIRAPGWIVGEHPGRRHRPRRQPRHRPRRRGRRPSPTRRSTPGSATRPRPARCSTSAAGPSRSTSRSRSSTPPAGPPTAAGMRTLAVRVDGDGRAGSGSPGRPPRPTGSTPDPGGRDHGEGRPGPVDGRPAGSPSYSIVRGPWELRLSRVDALAAGVDPAHVRLRVGGWPVAGPARATLDAGGGHRGRRRTALAGCVALSGAAATAGVAEYDDASPLGARRAGALARLSGRGRRLGGVAGRTPRRRCPAARGAGHRVDRRPTDADRLERPGRVARRRHHINTAQRRRGRRSGGPVTPRIVGPGPGPRPHEGVWMKRSIRAALGVAVAASLALAGCSSGERQRRPRSPSRPAT